MFHKVGINEVYSPGLLYNAYIPILFFDVVGWSDGQLYHLITGYLSWWLGDCQWL